MLRFTEGFYPTAEQKGSYKQGRVDLTESQEWEGVGKGVLILVFLILFVVRKKKIFHSDVFLQL